MMFSFFILVGLYLSFATVQSAILTTAVYDTVLSSPRTDASLNYSHLAWHIIPSGEFRLYPISGVRVWTNNITLTEDDYSEPVGSALSFISLSLSVHCPAIPPAACYGRSISYGVYRLVNNTDLAVFTLIADSVDDFPYAKWHTIVRAADSSSPEQAGSDSQLSWPYMQELLLERNTALWFDESGSSQLYLGLLSNASYAFTTIMDEVKSFPGVFETPFIANSSALPLIVPTTYQGSSGVMISPVQRFDVRGCYEDEGGRPCAGGVVRSW